MSSRTSMSSSASGALRLAEEYLVRGDVKEALSIYRTISEADPSNLDIKSRLGELCSLANQESDAVKVLSEVASSHVRQGHKIEAVAALNKVFKLSPSDPETLMDLAGLCAKCGLITEAERYYLKAADDYSRTGETARLASAYEFAAAIAPANAELQMKFGAVCQSSGRLEDSYRAFMKAAAQFSNRRNDGAALDAYRKAVKVALAGAGTEHDVVEAIEHAGAPEPDAGDRPAAADRRAPPPLLPEVTAPVGRAAVPRSEGARPVSKPEGTEDGLLAGKIATAEILFGFGRFDQAIALLKDLLELKPDDPRIHRKLKDIYLRSEMPDEAAGVYRELARIYRAQGNTELASDCMANSRRLGGVREEPSVQSSSARASAVEAQASEPAKIVTSARARAPLRVSTPALWEEGGETVDAVQGSVARRPAASRAASKAPREPKDGRNGPTESETIGDEAKPALGMVPLPSPEAISPGPSRMESPAAAKSRKVVDVRTAVRAACSRAALICVKLQVPTAKITRLGTRRRLVAAIVAVAVAGTAGGYLLIRSGPYGDKMTPQAAAQMDSVPVPSTAADGAGETQAGAAADSAPSAERRAGPSASLSSGSAPDPRAQRQLQSSSDPRTTTATPYATPIIPEAGPVKPTPPAVGPIESPASTTGGGPSVLPGALATDGSAAAPPAPVAPPIRRTGVMAGGEVLKRVDPVYPQTARSAHISGTVTVELAINELGNVVSARATSGPGMLAGAAVSAARGFKFKPITLDGVPVKSSRTVLFHFKE